MASVKHLRSRSYSNLMGTLLLSFLSLISVECFLSEFSSQAAIDEIKKAYSRTHTVVCLVKEECTIDCPISSSKNESNVTINWTWYFSQLDPKSLQLFSQLHSQRLNFTYQKAEVERYGCTISMSNGDKVEHHFTISVLDNREVPIIIEKPKSNMASIGGWNEFRCRTFNGTVTWLYDGKIIQPSDNFVVVGEYLFVHNVTVNLFGNYTCLVNSPRGTASSSAFLYTDAQWDYDESNQDEIDRSNYSTEPIKPFFAIVKESQTTVLFRPPSQSSELTLICPAGGSPRPNITWLKDGKPINPKFGLVYYKNWSMSICPGWYSRDSGNYTCIVCNTMGCINFTYDVRFTDEGLPRLPEIPFIKNGHPENVTAAVGAFVSFSCPSDSKSNDTMMWVKSTCTEFEQTYDKYEDKRSPVLSLEKGFKIVNLTKEHAGWYSCILSDGYRITCHNAYLKVV